MNILKKQELCLRDIASKIRDRDSFFTKLGKKGTVILKTKDERIAVEPTVLADIHGWAREH